MLVLHFLNNLDQHSGGPSVSVPALCRELAAIPGIEVCLAARPTENAVDPGTSDRFSVTWIDGGRRSVEEVFERSLESHSGDKLVVHLHGLWDPIYHRASRAAKKRGIPVVISVRGMLEPWALRHKRGKKWLAWRAYQKRDLLGATTLHATSPEERESILRAGFATSRILVIPNGVTPPPSFEETPGDPEREKILLFLGRLHPVKGLVNLLDAWATAAPQGWQLNLTGPDSEGHRRELEARIQKHRLESSVHLTGAVDEAGKWKALAGASCLILPSFSENFGMVVAEALAVGIPVVASTGSPWKILETKGAGWWVKPEVSALAAFLKILAATEPSTLVEMGQQGRDLVARDFAWPAVASNFAERYREC